MVANASASYYKGNKHPGVIFKALRLFQNIHLKLSLRGAQRVDRTTSRPLKCRREPSALRILQLTVGTVLLAPQGLSSQTEPASPASALSVGGGEGHSEPGHCGDSGHGGRSRPGTNVCKGGHEKG